MAAALGDLHIMQPWARASIGAGKTGAVYFTLGNHGAADRLVAVETPVARKARLHGHQEQDGVMKMRPVEAVEVPAGGHTELAPGGLHVMLMGLAAPLAEGDHFPLTLVFEKAGSVEVQVAVQGAAASGSETQGHGSHDHGAGHGQAGHGHDKLIDIAPGPDAPSLALELTKDPVAGWNLHVQTANFRFAPEHSGQAHQTGEGHAHLYMDGEKVARLYGPWHHIGKLPPGEHVIAVSLNANDHRPYAVGGKPLTASLPLEAGH